MSYPCFTGDFIRAAGGNPYLQEMLRRIPQGALTDAQKRKMDLVLVRQIIEHARRSQEVANRVIAAREKARARGAGDE